LYFRPLPDRANHLKVPLTLHNPFAHEPSSLGKEAALDLQSYLSRTDLGHDFGVHGKSGLGKMFGVLVGRNAGGQLGYLAAFSGKLDSGTQIPGFVPPVFDTFEPDGFYKIEEEAINQVNRDITKAESDLTYVQLLQQIKQLQLDHTEELAKLKKQHANDKSLRKNARFILSQTPDSPEKSAELEKINHESARQHFEYKDFIKKYKQKLAEYDHLIARHESIIHQWKQQRKEMSARLQSALFHKYTFLNAQGHSKSLQDIFGNDAATIPPSGAGECTAPKLLQFAYIHRIEPLAMAEFWWGKSPGSEIRKHGQFYPACRSKCLPILGHMLTGLSVDSLPADQVPDSGLDISVLYEDECIVIVNKPAQFLSVPGKEIKDSVLERLRQKYPDASGPLLVHRLDMSTSGVMIAAKNKEAHAFLQKQFENRQIKKRYVALLDGTLQEKSGKIELPLRVDLDDRPRQLVCYDHGKPSLTIWKVAESKNGETRIHFFPLTGRTHQLRVHAAHVAGLGVPIKGDDLYGKPDERLFLHAEQITFTHPVTRKVMSIHCPCPF
jgi:tRNA pseudouridine32 synthase/23S rRNA pseudouridine746 synthase